VTDEHAVIEAIAEAERLMGGAPTVVVCAAGIFPVAPLLEMPASEWNRTFATNVSGSMYCAREAVAAVRRSGHALTVVLLSSVGAFRSDWAEPSAAYCASKAAVSSMARSMAGEWAPFGVRVNAVAPGLIDTPMLRTMADPDAGTASLRSKVPLARLGTAADVARVVCFLASDESAYITGTTIAVDGGYLVK